MQYIKLKFAKRWNFSGLTKKKVNISDDGYVNQFHYLNAVAM